MKKHDDKVLTARSEAVFPERCAGILLHPTSLPGPHGIGCLGEQARRFVDLLVRARQSLWQVLPLGPTGFGDSPYASFCSAAGNPLLIDLEQLRQKGDLRGDDLTGASSRPVNSVNFGAVIPWKIPLLHRAARRFLKSANRRRRADYHGFCSTHAAWIDDFALFMAIKEEFDARADAEGVWGATWNSYWDKDIALREPRSVRRWRARLADSVEIHKVLQYYFFRQWQALRRYANDRGVRLIGDMPIFVASDSADVWVDRHLFLLDRNGRQTVVAGVPPDYFSEGGQLWGNPLYNWKAMADQDFAWWVQRFRNLLELVDIIRVDHFRGFVACWTVRAGADNAKRGRWVKAPGAALFDAVQRQIGELPLIAEDLGLITANVNALRDRLGLPGMRVLQFGFDAASEKNPHLPHNHVPNCVVYTGTHDNDTTKSWLGRLSRKQRTKLESYLHDSAKRGASILIHAAMASVAQAAVIPMQDVLNLGRRARMNTPSTLGRNWVWRLRPDYVDDVDTSRLADLTERYGRAPTKVS